MVVTSREQAVTNAERHLTEIADRQGLNGGDRYVVLEDQVVDQGNYWSVPYQSASFVKTGDISDMLAGNWPLMISKFSGEVTGVETPEWMEASCPNA